MNEKLKHTPEPLGVRSASECGQFWVEGRSSMGGDFNSGYVSFSGYFGSHGPHMFAAAPELLADLQEAASTLRRYEVLHRAKGTEDSTAKAEVNAGLAARFESTIAKATGKTSEAA